jgi:hypothetical protein
MAVDALLNLLKTVEAISDRPGKPKTPLVEVPEPKQDVHGDFEHYQKHWQQTNKWLTKNASSDTIACVEYVTATADQMYRAARFWKRLAQFLGVLVMLFVCFFLWALFS